MFYCGIDIAKRNHEASVIDSEGKPLIDSISITNTQEGCAKLFSLFNRLNIDKNDVVIGMEATGHYWLAVHEHLTEQNYDVILIDYYQSLKARGKHHSTAIGAVARKMCNIIFTILRENRPYEATPPKKKQEMRYD